MSSMAVVIIIISLVVLLLIMGAPVKPARFLAQTTVKIGIGVLLLFFANVFGGAITSYPDQFHYHYHLIRARCFRCRIFGSDSDFYFMMIDTVSQIDEYRVY